MTNLSVLLKNNPNLDYSRGGYHSVSVFRFCDHHIFKLKIFTFSVFTLVIFPKSSVFQKNQYPPPHNTQLSLLPPYSAGILTPYLWKVDTH